MLRRAVPAISVVVAAVAGAVGCDGDGGAPRGGTAVSSAAPGAASSVPCASPSPKTTVTYVSRPGFDPDETSLDVYAPAKPCGAPVVMWVHGGAYRAGDKANGVTDKVRLFRERGELFVSVNYRLTEPGNPRSAHYPDHFDDVAAAVAWVRDHIAGFGGDPARIALLGHSAGADIAANVTTNARYLGAHGLGLDAVRCAAPIDTEGFDKASANGPDDRDERGWWREALGNAPDYEATTSAKTYVRAGAGIHAMLVVVRGTPARRAIQEAFVEQLRAAGVHAVRVDASPLTHGEVNSRIGAPGDTVMTPPLTAFLDECFDGAVAVGNGEGGAP
jgi:acetyl esterase/lipase